MSRKYTVNLRNQNPQTVCAENVHVTPTGGIKLLNGDGRSAVLVAFFNAADVISVVEVK